MQSEKDFVNRLIELCKEDRELHDALVHFLNASASLKEARAEKLRQKQKPDGCVII